MYTKSLTSLIASVAMSAVALGVSAQESRADHAPTHDWTGPYIGAIFGIGSVNAEFELPSSGSGSGSFDALSDYGFMGGLVVGWNAQDGHMVYGIVGDVSFGEVDATENIFGVDLTVNTDLFATIRGRVGVAANDILLYGTAGLAILDGDVSSANGGASPGFTALGGVVGAGAELALSQDVSFKAELLYAFFDEDVDLGGVNGFFPGETVNIEEFYTVRFGINWHF
ncbi:MAG: outer membrane beta-barrel protein [Pseudomonadota bacterium]